MISRRHTCEQCQAQFSERRYLHGHIQRVHLGIKLFFCKLCTFSTHHVRYLRAHAKRHTLAPSIHGRVWRRLCPQMSLGEVHTPPGEGSGHAQSIFDV